MKAAFENYLIQCMEQDENIVLLTADDESDELSEINSKFPRRSFALGIAEENLVGIAAGMTKVGLSPIVYTYGSFLINRAFDFLRCDVCIPNLNVKMIGWGSGVKVNNYGPTHHTTEDIATLRALPNLSIFCPASVLEIKPIVDVALKKSGPVYIRLGKAFETEVFHSEPHFLSGKSEFIQTGKDITVISFGNIISNIIDALKVLQQEGISADLLNLSSIKPMDSQTILASILRTGKVLTVEEHQIIGGIGSIVAEIIAESNLNPKFKRMGFRDKFATEYGWHKDILEMNGLSTNDIQKTIKHMVVENIE